MISLPISLEAVQAWLGQGIEIVKHQTRIVIQPRSLSNEGERALAIQALREDGLLVDFEDVPLSPMPSPKERAALARELGAGRPLSEIAIEERRSGW